MSVCTMPMRGGEEGRGRADDCDYAERERRAVEERVRAGDHVDAGGHHGGGVDQGGDRRRAFHGVRQPDVQRNLRGFAGRAEDQQQRDGGEEAAVPFRMLRRSALKTVGEARACRSARSAGTSRAESRSRRCG